MGEDCRRWLWEDSGDVLLSGFPPFVLRCVRQWGRFAFHLTAPPDRAMVWGDELSRAISEILEYRLNLKAGGESRGNCHF